MDSPELNTREVRLFDPKRLGGEGSYLFSFTPCLFSAKVIEHVVALSFTSEVITGESLVEVTSVVTKAPVEHNSPDSVCLIVRHSNDTVHTFVCLNRSTDGGAWFKEGSPLSLSSGKALNLLLEKYEELEDAFGITSAVN